MHWDWQLLTEYALRSRVGNTAGVMTTALSYVTDWKMDRKIELGQKSGSYRGETSYRRKKAINHTNTHLPVAAAVLCRASWQDNSTGHQHLQQNHQNEVKVDLRTDSRRETRDTVAEGILKKINRLNALFWILPQYAHMWPNSCFHYMITMICDWFTLIAEGFRTSLQPNQTRQVVVTANVDT